MLQHLQLRAAATATERVELGRALTAEVGGVEFDERRERREEVDGFDVGQFARGEERNLHGAVRAEQCGEGGFGHIAVAKAEELIDAAVGERGGEVALIADLRGGQQQAVLGDVE